MELQYFSPLQLIIDCFFFISSAVGWSPKGKQLTVGLTDGSLALFKPDLTPVRNIARPPMEELGAVLSITWFTSTEFFIGYKQEAEEGGHGKMR